MYFTEAEKTFRKLSVRANMENIKGSVENCDQVGYNKKKCADSHKIREECIGETYEGKWNVS